MGGEEKELVMPGDRLSTEEEFLPASNTYVESGSIYSLVPGERTVTEGKIGVKSLGREITKFKKSMLVLGTVTGDLKNVLFVKIDNLPLGNKDYIAIKDGKIVLSGRGGPRPGFHDRRGPGGREREHEREARPAALGDILLSRILFDDDESFVLDLRDPELGVVFAQCEECNSPLEARQDGTLYCPVCKHVEHKKVSSLYGRHSEIEKALAGNARLA
jgi:exosome complex RNA-binding protein Csl4